MSYSNIKKYKNLLSKAETELKNTFQSGKKHARYKADVMLHIDNYGIGLISTLEISYCVSHLVEIENAKKDAVYICMNLSQHQTTIETINPSYDIAFKIKQSILKGTDGEIFAKKYLNATLEDVLNPNDGFDKIQNSKLVRECVNCLYNANDYVDDSENRFSELCPGSLLFLQNRKLLPIFKLDLKKDPVVCVFRYYRSGKYKAGKEEEKMFDFSYSVGNSPGSSIHALMKMINIPMEFTVGYAHANMHSLSIKV